MHPSANLCRTIEAAGLGSSIPLDLRGYSRAQLTRLREAYAADIQNRAALARVDRVIVDELAELDRVIAGKIE